MAGAYAAADLVVSRSGATTVAELAVCGKRAVLIPFPFAADNHQEYNARTLAARGAAEVIVQKDLTPETLAELIKKYAGQERQSRAPAWRIRRRRRLRGSVRTMFKRIKHIHFVGIGGIGMSGIAEVLLNLGYKVSGSDMKESDTTERLRKLGGEIAIGHRAENITSPHVVVISSAVKNDNVEVVAAREKQIPVIPRAEMLAELMRLKYGVAIAGAHGKTTTTSMVATVLAAGGIDPTVVIGGKLNSLRHEREARPGRVPGGRGGRERRQLSQAFADHRRGHEHRRGAPRLLQGHRRDQGGLPRLHQQGAFLRRGGPLPGPAAHPGAHPARAEAVSDLRHELPGRLPGKGRLAQAAGVAVQGAASRPGPRAGSSCPCRACTISTTASRPSPWRGSWISTSKSIRKALKEFSGVQRRFQIKGEVDGIIVVDDYGHHPTEVKATLAAAAAGHGAPGRGRVPAAPLHADAASARGVLYGLQPGGQAHRHGHLRGRREADPRRDRARRSTKASRSTVTRT